MSNKFRARCTRSPHVFKTIALSFYNANMAMAKYLLSPFYLPRWIIILKSIIKIVEINIETRSPKWAFRCFRRDSPIAKINDVLTKINFKPGLLAKSNWCTSWQVAKQIKVRVRCIACGRKGAYFLGGS